MAKYERKAPNAKAKVLELATTDSSKSVEQILVEVLEAFPTAKTNLAYVKRILSEAELLSGDRMNSSKNKSRRIITEQGFRANHEEVDSSETLQSAEQSAEERISSRYKIYEKHSRRVIVRGMPTPLICSGPPGLGKSYQVRTDLALSGRTNLINIENMSLFGENPAQYCKENNINGVYDTITGSITAVGLYQSLWYLRDGGVLILDDCDAVFNDPDALNILKAVLDTDINHRTVSWRKEANWLNEKGIEKTFNFKGSIVFLTNIDFESAIEGKSKSSEHFKALIDRSNYLSLTLYSLEDFMIRITQVTGGSNGSIVKSGLDEKSADFILNWVDENKHRFYNLSLRLISQIVEAYKDAITYNYEYKNNNGDSVWIIDDQQAPEGYKPTGEKMIFSVDHKEWQDDIIATKTKTKFMR